MSKGTNNKLTLIFVLSVSFIVASLITFLLTYYYSYLQFQLLGDFCGGILEKHPDCEQTILEVLKSNRTYSMLSTDENILLSFGYQQSDFLGINGKIFLIASLGFLAGGSLFLFSFWHWNKNKIARIKTLTGYLEKVNMGSQGLLLDTSEDEFSRLQDEIYKTITTLYQTRDAALEEKNNFADNLSNIAHQLKTPITAISLSVQMMKEHPSFDYSEQIRRQLNRLTHLEEALLLLSRIDAGTLVMKQNAVDVFTLLTLASDNLQELFMQNGISVDIPEAGEINIIADLDWTMEAIINLMKNCMEHTKAGTTVHCSYEKNPLYVQIRIWDEGNGFAKEDLPHLFERFYHGENGSVGGIGIGLSLSKAIIEMQNGIIRAFNLHENGACFEICFYSH
ncbi:MAG: HAMP domain-containing histidine kinase [Lachnospiraceae bacterium]|nr:HAMP domain-containing histidine kinase [Lachnospiraceae bacterium]